MSRLASLSCRRTVLLALVVAAVMATLYLVSPTPPAAALTCMPGFCEQAATTYYSGPDHNKVVGACACGSCSGEKTDFFTEHFVCCLC
jgi:hypothetical protein